MNTTLPLILICISGCMVKKTESVMPFYNFGYTASRLQPVIVSDAPFELRIWINNGTSIERIISISKDSIFNIQCYFDEIGVISNKRRNKYFYKKSQKFPRSGIETFFSKLDSLKIDEIDSQKEKDIPPHGMHDPFSLYVVEYKKLNKYHCFKFYTIFPFKSQERTTYTQLEEIIQREFPFDFYFK